MPSELPVAANGSDESITPVYELNQRPVSKRVAFLQRNLPTITQRSVSGTSLDSETAIDRTSDSLRVVVLSYRVFSPSNQDLQTGLPLLESIQRIVVGAKVLRHCSTASNRLIEHPAEHDAIDYSGMGAEPNDPARALIHGSATRQIHTGQIDPEVVPSDAQ